MYGLDIYADSISGHANTTYDIYQKSFSIVYDVRSYVFSDFDVTYNISEEVENSLEIVYASIQRAENSIEISYVMGGYINSTLVLVNSGTGWVDQNLTMPYSQGGYVTEELDVTYQIERTDQYSLVISSNITYDVSSSLDVVCSIDESSSMIVVQNKKESIPNNRRFTLD